MGQNGRPKERKAKGMDGKDTKEEVTSNGL